MKRVAILTGGGDCPGLNAAIRAIAKPCILEDKTEVIGIVDGFEGLIKRRVRRLSYDDVSNILALGGTILGTSNKADPFRWKVGGRELDCSDEVVRYLKELGVDVLFCIGGDGTLSIANRLLKKFPRIIAIPKTIDNDLAATEQTFGFDTACNFVMEAIDRLHSTAQSHHRAMVIEVMGRYAGWIALQGGMAGGGDIILIPELPFKMEIVLEAVRRRARKGKKFSIVVVAEGARPRGGGLIIKKKVEDSPDPIRLGGVGNFISEEIEKNVGCESRVIVLGHLQRGGAPTFFDRILATRYGIEAVRLARAKDYGRMVALKGGKITSVPIGLAVSRLKLVPKKHPLITGGMEIGVSFGIESIT
jgi:phosphofructokinase-like protein